jgi:hypothetical protein
VVVVPCFAATSRTYTCTVAEYVHAPRTFARDLSGPLSAMAATTSGSAACESRTAGGDETPRSAAVASRAALVRVIGRRMRVFAPAGKRALATCLLPRLIPEPSADHGRMWTVSVEAVGSGAVLVPALQIDRHGTVGALRARVAGTLSVRLFVGHGGAELAKQDDAQSVADSGLWDGATLVVVQHLCDGCRQPFAQVTCDRCKTCTVCEPRTHYTCCGCQKTKCPLNGESVWCHSCRARSCCECCDDGVCAVCSQYACWYCHENFDCGHCFDTQPWRYD